MNKQYELETGPLAMYVFSGDCELACAMACTHGGWAIYLGSTDFRRANNPVDMVDSRRDAVQWLEHRFPGLLDVA